MAAVANRIRVGVFADSPQQPKWMVEGLGRAAAQSHAEIVLVAVPPGAGDKPRVPLLWRAYSGIDRRLFGSRAGWSDTADATALVAPAQRAAGDDWRLAATQAKLDVAFVLGDIADESLDGLARFGTWRFCFGENAATCEALAAVGEVLAGENVVASGVRIHRAGQPDRVACRSWARTFLFSVAKTRDTLFAKTSDFAARALRDLALGGEAWLARQEVVGTRVASVRAPGSPVEVATMGLRLFDRTREKALTLDQWSIAYRFSPGDDFDGALEGFFRLDPPKGWYWADPFPIEVAGRHYIFFEELPLGAAKAHISVVEVDRQGRASQPVKVLERDYHLSYPFLVEEDGALYMIPETGQNRTVEVYRCEEFPTRWKLERVLLSGLFCADATLHREQGRWWMFANVALPGELVNDELHLFTAEKLLGDWRPHPRNPVKSDVRSARPAGRLFRRGEALYRPGQICTPLYGSGIALHRVERLDTEDYVEREERRIVPRGGEVLGIHTFNRAGELCVTDAFTRPRRF